MLFRVWIKKFLPRTLFGRALMIIVMPLILLQIVTTHIFYDRHWDTITWRLSSAIAGDIAVTLDSLRNSPDIVERALIFDAVHRHLGLQMTLIPNEILPNEPTESGGLLDRMLTRAMDEQVRRPFRIDTSAYKTQVVIDVQLPDAVLRTVAPGKRLFSSTTYIFIMWMIGTSLVLFAVASIFMRNQIRPIRRLAGAVDRLGKGREIDGEFKIEGATEVRQAAQAFQLMRDRIRRQMRQRTDMLSGVSHDLRTPLTRMKLQLAMLSDSDDVFELKSDVEEMEHMIDGYLAFARGEGDEQVSETDIAELVEESVAVWKRDNVKIDCHIEDKLTASVRPQAVRRCLGNLIANARRYADHVWVHAGRRGEQIEITIDDDGPGIAADRRDDVFRPFFRLDQSRNPETGGTGLGLAIALDVARGHGGDISLEDSPQGGLRARIRLPI
jgi:two-component system, OmpR family, osmolarity sensor histidine kinase EnvZ